MKAMAWSLLVTGAAAALPVSIGHDSVDLRWVGASGGAALALAGVLLGILKTGSRRRKADPECDATLLSRFFRDRRSAARHRVEIPVRVSVNGSSCEATLLNVSSSGALLRLRPHPGQRLLADVGAPVSIEDYPAGTVARVGPHGLYVDFAVEFQAARSDVALETSGNAIS